MKSPRSSAGELRSILVVTDYVLGQRLAYRIMGGPFPFSGSFDLAGDGDGAILTATFEATPTGVFAFLGPLFAKLVRRKFERTGQPEAPHGRWRTVACRLDGARIDRQMRELALGARLRSAGR